MVDRSRSDVSAEAKLQEMIKAVEGEVAARRKTSKDRWRRIGTGQRLGSSPEDRIYGFPSAGNPPVANGKLVQLAARGAMTSARVLATNGRLVLRCFDDLGNTIRGARIRWDSTWLFEELKRVLERLSPVGRLQRLLLEPREAQTELAPLAEPLDQVTRNLNADQTRVVRRAVGSDLSLVWGPPGSGKTTTLAALAEAWYREGVTLLVTAWSNRTVDKLLLAIAERLEPKLPDRRILRVGPIESCELRERYGQYVATDGLHELESRSDVSCFDRADAVREVLDRHLAASCDPEASPDPVESELQDILRSDRKQLEAQKASVLQATETARSDLLDRARVVATTLPRTYLPGQLERRFGAMILDEASAASVPGIVAASDRATTHLVVAGDPRQLPPVVRSRNKQVRDWMERDAFAVGGVIPPRSGAERPSCLSVLPTQYRMHPRIANMVSELAYGSRLETTSTWTAPADPPPALGGDPLVLVDTSRLPAFFARKTVGGNDPSERPDRSNLLHRIVVGRLLHDIFDSEVASPSHETAVLTPYRDQVTYLHKGFGHLHPATISTVHGAQGEEYGTVLLDLPEQEGVPISPFMKARSVEHKGARVLNVAASRAKQQLIVIANLDYFRPRHRRAPFAWRFLQLVAKHASGVLDAEEVLSTIFGEAPRMTEAAPEPSCPGASTA